MNGMNKQAVEEWEDETDLEEHLNCEFSSLVIVVLFFRDRNDK